MVLETKGKNVLVSNKTEMRTLQVLNDGEIVDVSKGAVLRLSYFKSGLKETISGPCRVKLGQLKSEKVSGEGKIVAQTARESSTDLDDSSNLRRTGGALQASSGIVPENNLAFADRQMEVAPQRRPVVAPGAPQRDKSRTGAPSPPVIESTVASLVAPAEFQGLSYSYLSPKDVREIAWTRKGDYQFEIRTEKGPVYSEKVSGERIQIPTGRLTNGQVYQAVLSGSGMKKTQYFRILSKDQAKEYRALVARIKEKEKNDPRALYSKLIYLNAQLGLLTGARATTRDALKTYPNDEGFKTTWKELNRKLNQPE